MRFGEMQKLGEEGERQEWGDCAFEEDGIEAEKGVEKVEKERKRGGGEKTDWKQRKGFGKVEREMKREG